MSYVCNQIQRGGRGEGRNKYKNPNTQNAPIALTNLAQSHRKEQRRHSQLLLMATSCPALQGVGYLLHVFFTGAEMNCTTSLVLLTSEVNHHCFDQLCQRWGEEKSHHWTNSSLPNWQVNGCDSVLVLFSHEGHLTMLNTVLSWLYWVSKWNSSVFSLICKQGQQLEGLVPHSTLQSLQTH